MITEEQIAEIVWRNEPVTMRKLLNLFQSELLREKISLLKGLYKEKLFTNEYLYEMDKKITELEKELNELE